MTLILSQITPDYVIQVSDRRVTLPNGSLYDDDSNKAVLYNQHFAFAYTGLAEMTSGVRTDEWLSKILFEQSEGYFDDALTAVCKAATTAMASNQFSEKRLAIVGVGGYTRMRNRSFFPHM